MESTEACKVLRLTFLKDVLRQMSKRLTRIPCDRIAERSFQVVHFGSGIMTRGEGVD